MNIMPRKRLTTPLLVCMLGIVQTSSFSTCITGNRLLLQEFNRLSGRFILSSTSDKMDDTKNNNDISSDTDSSIPPSCPFNYQMAYQRKRINLSEGRSNDYTLRPNAVSNMKLSFERSKLERKYSQQVNDKKFFWIDVTKNLNWEKNDFLSSMIRTGSNKDDKLRGEMGIFVASNFWRFLSNAVEDMNDSTSKTWVVCFPNSSFVGLRRLTDIANWIDDEQEYFSSSYPYHNRNPVSIQTCIDESSNVPTVIISCKRDSNKINDVDHHENKWNPSLIQKRMKAWVDRLLVKEKICPFTRSSSKSGQGLADVNVPVGSIQYDYSRAKANQMHLLMADTWESISRMIAAGPEGKNGISSILLCAPEFDDKFKLWGEVIFTVLEAVVSASNAESIIGVVCFHPEYATPDGTTWPGWGHMHSTIRLRKWLTEENSSLSNKLSDQDIAAGGAFQRRTPHSCINVLRSEQLAAAERKRSTKNLYATNIKTLYDRGFSILEKELIREQCIM